MFAMVAVVKSHIGDWVKTEDIHGHVAVTAEYT